MTKYELLRGAHNLIRGDVMKRLLAGLGVLLALSGCGDKSNEAAGTQKAVEAGKVQEKASTSPEQQQAGNNDAILARHMKCRQEQGTDCFKILEEIQKGQGSPAPQAQQQMGKKEHNDAVMARHMKCRQEQGADCFKILEEMQK